MRSLRLNSDRNLTIDNSGNIAQITNLEAVLQNCETAMRAQLGEMLYAADEGTPTRETVWDRYNPLQFSAAGRNTLSNVPGVIRIKSFDVNRIGDTLQYTALIETQYGDGSITSGE